ncbi:MarP family serine protease [Microbacterium rhizophilus]|uniref:MarP family serine protease n=1 Tax=Microbacterium rhizophilus TaxID=3138934 RepID=UPI0031F0C453
MLPIADIVIVVLLIAALLVGLRVGLFSALGALCGLVAAGLAAPWVLPMLARVVTDPAWRPFAVIAGAIALLALGAGLGSVVGSLLRRGADRLHLKVIERLLGGALGVVAAALAIALTGSGIASAGIPVVSSAVSSSSALRTIDRITPAPVSEAMARLHAAVLGDTVLPTIDGLLGAVDTDVAVDVDTNAPALLTAAESVARIRGVADACSRSLSGTGFVAAEDRIVTNAHVVAGMQTPVVELPGEPARDGRIVYFDPVDDLAVIAVDVDAPALPVVEPLVPGDPAAIQGFPYGGPFRSVAATVAAVGPAPIPDIHGGSAAPRQVYALAAAVHPGNSGGPLLTTDGAVAGVVFARDEVQDDVGYAMTTAELMPVLDQLDGATEPVPTGDCAL